VLWDIETGQQVTSFGGHTRAGGSLSTCRTLIVRLETADAAAAFTHAAVRQLQTNSESLLMEGVAPVYNVHTQFNVDGFIWKKVNHGTGMTTTAMTIQATGRPAARCQRMAQPHGTRSASWLQASHSAQRSGARRQTSTRQRL